MRQVYKGEIEEKNQAASSNSTARIILAFYPTVNCFPTYFQAFCQKTTNPLFPSFSGYFRPYIKEIQGRLKHILPLKINGSILTLS